MYVDGMPKGAAAKSAIYQDVLHFAQEKLPSKDYFVCIYGSYPTEHFSDESDLDVVFVAESYDEPTFKTIKEFVVSEHTRYGLTIDEEVPYANKLLVTYEDIRDAASLDVFGKSDDGRYAVPEITNDAVFLSSRDARKRLILNAFTTPHVFVYGHSRTYEALKKECELAVVRLARGIALGRSLSKTDILQALLESPDGNGGRAHLGYKGERREVIAHLRGLIGRSWEIE